MKISRHSLRKKKRISPFFKPLLLVLFLGLAFGVFVEMEYRNALESAIDDQDDTSIPFFIEKGMVAKDVAKKLEKNDIVQTAWHFSRYIKSSETKLQAGMFTVSRNQSIKELAKTFETAVKRTVKVTIPEGWTVEQIDKKMVDMELSSVGDILTCAKECILLNEIDIPEGNKEGYFFPDTYFVDQDGFSAEKFLQRMIHNTENRFTEQMRFDTESAGKSIHDIIIMASLIEKEAASHREKAEIAGVLWGRLQINMRLDVDATVRYALGKWNSPLFRVDLDSDSPYNTRKFKGLPPGPIANPGIDSIRAAIYPKSTEARYYLHDPSGQIHFAETLEEHNRNKAKYLR